MKNLPLPPRDAVQDDLVKAIRQYTYRKEVKGHTITGVELTAMLQIYDQYDQGNASANDVLKGSTLEQSLRDAIYDAYDKTQEGRKLSFIRERVRKGVDLCPVCGIDPAIELDHHLPRSVFKPLAIYVRNLVPMCHNCNKAKLDQFGDAEDTGFINAYFDLLPDVDFLLAHVVIQGGGLVVRFEIDHQAALPAGYAARLSAQIAVLELNSRFAWEINKYLSSQAVVLQSEYTRAGADAVRAYLLRLLAHETRAYYRNHWLPALLRALASHDVFVDGGFATVFPVQEEIMGDLLGEA